MLYFILWVIFLLFVILAIPVTSMLENRKYRAAKSGRDRGTQIAESSDDEQAGDEFTGDGEMEMADVAGDDLGAFAETTPAGGDDFSAFDEEFK